MTLCNQEKNNYGEIVFLKKFMICLTDKSRVTGCSQGLPLCTEHLSMGLYRKGKYSRNDVSGSFSPSVMFQTKEMLLVECNFQPLCTHLGGCGVRVQESLFFFLYFNSKNTG